MTNNKFIPYVLIIGIIILAYALVIIGPADIGFSSVVDILLGKESSGVNYDIIVNYRIPKLLTAFFACGALGVAGLLMQTFFKNPIAGPFVLGISSGASLGVALWVFCSASFVSIIPLWVGPYSNVFFSLLGSFLVLFAMIMFSIRVRSSVFLLIVGLLFSHITSGIISVLINISDAERIKSFMLWTLGSFSKLGAGDLLPFIIVIMLCLFAAVLIAKDLNIMMLGDSYAHNLGQRVSRLRFMVLAITAVLTGIVTSFCGPIVFVGVITPHLARPCFKNNHFYLLIGAFIIGGGIGLIVELVSSLDVLPLPVNAILGLLGAPIIFLYLLVSYRRTSQI